MWALSNLVSYLVVNNGISLNHLRLLTRNTALGAMLLMPAVIALEVEEKYCAIMNFVD
jgi:hypothetical protein